MFLFALAVAAMASCSENEVTQDGARKAIGFNDVQWGNAVATRADLETTKTLGVFAYQTTGATGLYIDDETLSYTDAWKLSKTYYWPAENPELKFFAYGPKDANITSATCGHATGSTPTFTYTIANLAAAKETDVIVDLDGDTKDKQEVVFGLSHVLTQVKFEAKLSATSSTLTAKIESITVKAPKSAKFAISSGTASWTEHTEPSTAYLVSGEVLVSSTTPTPVGDALNMIPGSTTTNPQIVVVAVVYDTATSTKIATKTVTITCDGVTVPHVPVWEAGTAVTYTITLDPAQIANDSGSAITFNQPTVGEWATGTGSIGL